MTAIFSFCVAWTMTAGAFNSHQFGYYLCGAIKNQRMTPLGQADYAWRREGALSWPDPALERRENEEHGTARDEATFSR